MTQSATRRPRPDGGDRRAYDVEEIARLTEDALRVAFPHRVWVLGEVVHERAEAGGRAFHLGARVPGRADVLLPSLITTSAMADIDDYLLRNADVAVDDLVVDGHLLRAGGLIRYRFDEHRLLFEVTALDPRVTEEQLAERRRSALAGVRTAALGERQRSLSVPVAPLRVHVVGPAGDEALEQTQQILQASGYAIAGRHYSAPLQGAAGARLANVISAAAGGDPDVILLVRGTRRPLGLAPFDDEHVAGAIAGVPVPVLTGIVSPGGPTVADEVAYRACGSPPAAANAVIRRLRQAETVAQRALVAAHDAAEAALGRAADELAAAVRGAQAAAERAELRASTARRRLRWTMWLAAVVVLIGVVAATVVLGSPWWLLGLLLVGGLAAAPELGRLQPRLTSGARDVTDLDYASALDQLREVTRKLDATANPEVVGQLRGEADELAERCRAILHGVARPSAGNAPVEAQSAGAQSAGAQSAGAQSGEAQPGEASPESAASPAAPAAGTGSEDAVPGRVTRLASSDPSRPVHPAGEERTVVLAGAGAAAPDPAGEPDAGGGQDTMVLHPVADGSAEAAEAAAQPRPLFAPQAGPADPEPAPRPDDPGSGATAAR